jgi:predicted CXXCH cytochrome family protein
MDGQGRTKAAAGVVGLFLCGILAAAAGNPPAPPTLPPSVTPGYIDDRACASCHAEIAGASPQLGMARSFYRPKAEQGIEDFRPPGIARFDHPASHQSFSMERRGDRLFFKRWQTAADGLPINVFEHEVDWILGSGNHARIYLYRTPEGELYQFPLAWYTQEGRWGMAPGYDRPDHDGVLRRVRRECLFCHDGYPEVAAGSVGSDAYGAPQVYPERLPEGLGCQRCHGPGGEHVRRASGGAEPREAIRAAIVNPARLGGPRAEDVCNQCHLQPEVTLPMVRRFGRGDYSFRPGEPLPDYLVQTDFDDGGKAGKAGEERFEINHHAYRLRQSRCFVGNPENPAKLRCWTCHDPHRRLPQEELATRVRTACLACHGGAGLAGAGTTCKRPGAPPAPVTPVSDPVDCASCHMPKRRPRDVVHVVMTDHKIQRFPGGPAEPGAAGLTAPRAEADPILTVARLYAPERAPGGELGKLYLTLSEVRTGAYPDAVERLEGLLAAAPSVDPTPYLELAAAEIKEQRFAVAERTLGIVLARSPENPQALARQGVALAALGRPREAEERWRQALAVAKSSELDRTEVRFNLALLLAGEGRTAEAVPLFEQVLAVRPTLVAGWVQLGNVAARLGRLDRAVEVYRRALEMDPTQTDAYLGLGAVLERRGARAEALRVLTHGALAARRPAVVAAALAALQAPPPHPG